MGIRVKATPRFVTAGSRRGFTILEQVVALCLIVIGTVCALEMTAYCLISLSYSEQEWQQSIEEWNQIQEDLLEDRGEKGDGHETNPPE